MPTEKSLGLLPNILVKLLQTVQVSIMATVIAALLAFVLALFGAVPTRPSPLISGVVRLIASFFRNIPVVAWAMILIFSFGQSMLTGFIAIFIETFGFLVRSFIEVIDETSSSSVEALRATGANYFQTIFQAVVPSVKPMAVSALMAQQSLEEGLEGLGVEDLAHHAYELAGAQADRAEASHGLAGRRMLQDGVLDPRWYPHSTAGAMLLEVTFIQAPQFDVGAPRQTTEFFYCRDFQRIGLCDLRTRLA